MEKLQFTIKELLEAIKTGGEAVTADHIKCMKAVNFAALQREMLEDVTLTPDEFTINQYIAKLRVKVKKEGETQATREEKLKEAEATFKTDMQVHRTELTEEVVKLGIMLNGLDFGAMHEVYVKKLTTYNKAMANPKVTTKPAKPIEPVGDAKGFKAWILAQLKTLPVVPKKPTIRTGGGNGGITKAWNALADVTNLQDGSTNKYLWDALVAKGEMGLNRAEMDALMVAKYPDRKKANNEYTCYAAVSGKLPLTKHAREGVFYFTANVPKKGTES